MASYGLFTKTAASLCLIQIHYFNGVSVNTELVKMIFLSLEVTISNSDGIEIRINIVCYKPVIFLFLPLK